ncbi:aspartyl/asparaginyl beta-hydroxylase domain-containing protein [Ottowia thiooxydans]|uniref:aspartyl/asparaginyl beta-hydroxylase domain-containing protein n=1 Tax=Ottowia thiooxydans TaxID=219182 RepID=UPI0003FC4C87|nr:aspartyl/asparaginyl beta-hydroxylase domain-containing protein [Ottowia thiooxydans]
MKTIIFLIVLLFAASAAVMHFRGRVRLKASRQVFDHSTFMAPINVFMLAFSGVPRQPYLPPERFPELAVLQAHWQEIREEALALAEAQRIRAAANMDDAGFNSFFKTGWKRFYLKWYGQAHPSATELCPRTTALLAGLPSIKAAMFAELPHGAKLGKHRDPYAGSLRYHLGLVAPGDERCFIDVDGERYVWHEGEGVVFDETYIHYAENQSGQNRIVLFCDVERPMTFRFAQWLNHWFGRNVVAAASSPNSEGDPTGVISKLFRISFYAGKARRAFKAWNPTVYKLTKVGLLVGVVALFVWW